MTTAPASELPRALRRALLSALLALAAAPALARADGLVDLSGAGSPFPTAAAVEPDRLLVRFDGDATAAERADALAAVDGVTLTRVPGLPGTVEVELPAGSAELAAARVVDAADGVRWAEPVYRVSALGIPNDALFGQLWGMTRISAPQAWDLSTGSSAVRVGIVDTGVYRGHADLAANIGASAREIPGNGADDDGDGLVDDTWGWDFVNRDNDPADEHGHGTHVSGTVGGVGGNGIGVVGVSPRVSLFSYRVLAASGSGSDADVAAAFALAGRNGMDVVNASLGAAYFSQAQLDAINASPNTLFVFAAGNSAANVDAQTFSPCALPAPNVICVASVDADDALSSFSNYGATTVDLSAPGGGIVSSTMDGQYGTKSGTSMASPHVAGAAALVLATHPTLTPVDVRSAILAGVDPIPGQAGKTVTGGRLDVRAALEAADRIAGSQQVSAPRVVASTSTDATVEATVTTSTGGALTVQYGATTAYGATASAGSLPASASPQVATAALAGLAPNQLYHLRAVLALPDGRTVAGPDATFATSAVPPILAVSGPLPVTVADPLAASVAVSVTTGNAATTIAVVPVDADVSVAGTTLPVAAATAPTTVDVPLGALLRPADGGTRTFDLVATSVGGTRTLHLTVRLAELAPVAETGPSAGVGATDALVAVRVDPRGRPVRWLVEYGTGPALDQATDVRLALEPWSGAVHLDDLEPGTTYRYRVVALPLGGSAATAGAVRVLTTPARAGDDAGTVSAGAAAALPAPTTTPARPSAPGERGVRIGGVVADGRGALVALVRLAAFSGDGTLAVGCAATAAPCTAATRALSGDGGARIALVRVAGLAPRTAYDLVATWTPASGGASSSTPVAARTAATAAAHPPVPVAVTSTAAAVLALAVPDAGWDDPVAALALASGTGSATSPDERLGGDGAHVVRATLPVQPQTTAVARVLLGDAASAGGEDAGSAVFAVPAADTPPVALDGTTRLTATAVTLVGTLAGSGTATVERLAADGVTWSAVATGAADASAAPGEPQDLRVRVPLAGAATFRLVAVQGGQRRAVSAPLAVAPPPSGAVVTAYAPRDVAGTSALVSGWVNALGASGTRALVQLAAGVDGAGSCRVASCPVSETAPVALPAVAGDRWVRVPLVGLVPGTAYRARLVARTAAGDVAGDWVAFTTDAPGPSVLDEGVDDVAATSVRAAVRVHPNGAATTVHARAVGDDGGGVDGPAIEVAADGGFRDLVLRVPGLAPATRYTLHLVATSVDGARDLDVGALTTAPAGPALGTPAVRRVAATALDVAASATPGGVPAELRLVRYADAAGTAVVGATPWEDVGSGEDPADVLLGLRGLAPGSTVWWRVEARGGGAAVATPAQPVATTLAEGPTAEIGDVTVDGGDATLVGVVNPGGAAVSARFAVRVAGAATDVVLTPARVLAGEEWETVVETATALPRGAYAVRLVVTPTTGAAVASDPEPFAIEPDAPVLGAVNAVAATDGTATVSTTVTANDLPVTLRVDYGADAGYGASASAAVPASGSAPVAAGVRLTGLVPGSDIVFRLVATANGQATTSGPHALHVPAATPGVALVTVDPAVGTLDVAGTVDGHGAATSWLVTATPVGGGAPLATAPTLLDATRTGTAQAVRGTLSGVAEGVDYTVALVARNADGSASSSRVVRSAARVAPTLVASSAAATGGGTAAVDVTVATGGAAGTVTAAYGLGSAPETPLDLAATATAAATSAQQTVRVPLAGLRPLATYRVRARVDTSAGTASGSLLTLAVPLAAPAVATPTTRAITSASATLGVTVDPYADGTTRLHWALSADGGASWTATPDVALAAGAARAVDTVAQGLQAGTPYVAYAVATNAAGGSTSARVAFTTAMPPAPAISATGATTTRTAATVTATVDPNGLATQVWVELGPTSAYGTATTPIAIGGTGARAVSLPVPGLAPGTTSHYRVVATSAGGRTSAADSAFTTAPVVAPRLSGLAVTGATRTGGTLAVTVDAGGDATAVRAIWSTPGGSAATAPVDVAASDTARAVTLPLTGLAAGTAYAVTVSAVNGAGTATAAATVTTAPAAAPAIGAATADAPAPRALAFHVPVDARGAATTVVARLASSGLADVVLPAVALPAADGAVTVDLAFAGLAPGRAYVLSVTAASAAGTTTATPAGGSLSTTRPATAVLDQRATVTRAGATLVATVDSYGRGTAGLTASARNATTGATTPAGSCAVAGTADPYTLTCPVTGLAPATAYTWWISAAPGTQGVFTTLPPAAPVVSVTGVAASGPTALAVTGRVDGDGAPTSWTLQVQTAAGWQDAATGAIVAGGGPVVSGTASGLAGATTYPVRIAATNAGGTTTSAAVDGTTAAYPAPAVAIGAVDTVTRVSARIVASITTGGYAATAQAYVGPAGGALAPSGAPVTAQAASTPTSVALPVAGLAPGAAYDVRVDVTGPGGTPVRSSVVRVTTVAASTPAVTGTSLVARTSTSLTVRVSVATNGSDTTPSVRALDAAGAVVATATGTQVGVDGPQDLVLDGLAAATAYQVVAGARNASGAAPPPAAIAATTLAAPAPAFQPTVVSPTATGAAIAYRVSPQGATTHLAARIAVAGSTSYTPFLDRDVPGLSGVQTVTGSVAGLSPSTTYNVVTTAANAGGTTTDVARFTTAPLPAVIGAPAVSGVTVTGGTVSVAVDPLGQAATWTASKAPASGTTCPTDLAAYIPVTGAGGSLAGPATVRVQLTGLAPASSTCVVVSVSTPGTTVGSAPAVVATLLPPAPTTTTLAATPGAHALAVGGTVVTGGYGAEARVEWGTSPTALDATTDPVAVPASATPSALPTLAVTGLAPATTYWLRVVLTGPGGVTRSTVATATTLAAPLPTVQAPVAANVALETATLVAALDAHGEQVVHAYLEWGAGGAFDHATADRAGLGATALRVDLAGLAPATTYAARAVVTTAGGTVRSAATSFATGAPTAPTVTLAAPSRTATTVTVNATVSAGTAPVDAAVTFSAPGRAPVTVAAGAVARGGQRRVAATLRDLAPGTTVAYTATAHGAHGDGSAAGAVATLPPAPPVPTTLAPVRITATTALVAVQVAPNRTAGTVVVRVTAPGADPRLVEGPSLAATDAGTRRVLVELDGLPPAAAVGYAAGYRLADGSVVLAAARSLTTAAAAVADVAPPVARLRQPACPAGSTRSACAALLATGGSWATLRGTATDAGSGVAYVEVSAVRRAGGACSVFDGVDVVARTCAAATATWVPVPVASGAWSVRLPRVPVGTWTFRVRGVDRAGLTQARLADGVSVGDGARHALRG